MLRLFRKPEQTMPVSTVKNFVRGLADVVYNAADTLTWKRLFGVLGHERAYADNTGAALKLSAVMCSMNIYTGMVSAVPRRMYSIDSETGEKVRIVGTTSHPASRIFSHYFHPEMSADNGLLAIVYDILMDGNAYFVRELDGQGRTSRIYYVHPSRIPRGNIFRASGQEQLSSGRQTTPGELLYRIDTGTSSRDIKTEPLLLSRSEVVHFKNSVQDMEYHRGQGFIFNSERSMSLYDAAEEFGWKFYTKGYASQLYLTTENRLAPEVLKRIEANFEQDPNAPLESIFRTRVLEQGLKPVNTGIPMQHLQFIETRAFSIEDVARYFNIPTVLLHSYMGGQQSLPGLTEAITAFVQTGIGPFLTRLGNQFRSELLPLPSQMLYAFEFEQLYLYRNVIDKFTISLRNLFETGIIDRKKAADLLGMHIDPSDAAANPRYVPVNLMTVEHSLHLEEGARLANEMQQKSIETAQKTLDGMVPAPEPTAATGSTEAEPPSGRMDKSPSQSGIDKRLRNANASIQWSFDHTVNSLAQYEARVLAQKRESRPDDYDAAVAEFYAENSKFRNMLAEQVLKFRDVVESPEAVDSFVDSWLSNRSKPETLILFPEVLEGAEQ